jgi:hypothetical protein
MFELIARKSEPSGAPQRLICMALDRNLRDEYRATWDEFSRKLQQLQSSVETGAQNRIESALIEVEKARLAHNAARDRLAEHLTGEFSSAALPPHEQRVRRTARLLWEFAGKPHGTAETDWLRAEQLVRAAGASA